MALPSTAMAMTGSRFFQFYLNSYFNFPKEIKNDIIYCQRAFHAHLKVHQMLVSKLKIEDGLTTIKEKMLKELEDEMLLINGEQQYLLLRLRRVIDEFYKTVQRSGIPADPELTNQLIFKEVGPHIHDTSLDIKPVSVNFYNTESKLMEKYIEPLQDRNKLLLNRVDDVKMSVGDRKALPQPSPILLFPTMATQQIQQQQQQQQLQPSLQIKTEFMTPPQNVDVINNTNTGAISNGVPYAARNIGGNNFLTQVSLLKPISQRMLTQLRDNLGARSLYPEQAIGLNYRAAHPLPLYGHKSVYEMNAHPTAAATEKATAAEKATTTEKVTAITSTMNRTVKEESQQPSISNMPVSKNVKMSRLNLQQALKKARTDTLAAKASANILTKPQMLAPATSNAATAASTSKVATTTSAAATVTQSTLSNKMTKTEAKKAVKANSIKLQQHTASNNILTRNTTKLVSRVVSSTSSSDELSATEREPTPPTYDDGRELKQGERWSQQQHFGQEAFLRFLGLVTPEMHVQLQQRRSKRRRRNVHSNERSDYHYGRIDHHASSSAHPTTDIKQKHKAFLLSPQAKRTRKRKHAASVDKNGSGGGGAGGGGEEPLSSRSHSSSPEEKRACNECLKRTGSFEQCDECKGFYHQRCHNVTESVGDVSKPAAAAAAASSSQQQQRSKICPACKRTQDNLLEKETQMLHSTAHRLEQKLAAEKLRRSSLQQTSKLYKMQMRKLFNIVKTIKTNGNDRRDSSD